MGSMSRTKVLFVRNKSWRVVGEGRGAGELRSSGVGVGGFCLLDVSPLAGRFERGFAAGGGPERLAHVLRRPIAMLALLFQLVSTITQRRSVALIVRRGEGNLAKPGNLVRDEFVEEGIEMRRKSRHDARRGGGTDAGKIAEKIDRLARVGYRGEGVDGGLLDELRVVADDEQAIALAPDAAFHFPHGNALELIAGDVHGSARANERCQAIAIPFVEFGESVDLLREDDCRVAL